MHVGDCSFGIWRIHIDDIGSTTIGHDCCCQHQASCRVSKIHIAYSWVDRAPEWVRMRQIFLVDGPR